MTIALIRTSSSIEENRTEAQSTEVSQRLSGMRVYMNTRPRVFHGFVCLRESSFAQTVLEKSTTLQIDSFILLE
jgi:hypothetical protein